METSIVARSKSSSRWLQEHFDDDFVRRAKQQNYRSRAVYKLIELDEREKLLKANTSVVELGAAPGGWTQYIAQRIGSDGRIIASDILSMDSFANVDFVCGDFTEQSVMDQITNLLSGSSVDLVLSDMAPNLSGVAVSDQARAMYLAELALDAAKQLLVPNGIFLTKLFQGEGFDAFIRELRQNFEKVHIRKPAASRDRSREVYAVARNLYV